MKIKLLLVGMLLFCLQSQVALAGPIFDVNRIIGSGSVTGTIETDGTIGELNTGKILDWGLTLNDGIGSLFIDKTNSQAMVAGPAFIASATELLFDFRLGGGDFFLFQSPTVGSGQDVWCVETNGGCVDVDSESVMLTGSPQTVGRSGLVVIGTLHHNNVPEPATLALLLAGLAGFRLCRRTLA